MALPPVASLTETIPLADAAGERGNGLGEFVGGADDVAGAVAEGSGPADPPFVERLVGPAPAQAVVEDAGDVFEIEGGVGAVPMPGAFG